MTSTPPDAHKKGHVRNASSIDERRVAVPRRRTKGPLDFEENPPQIPELTTPPTATTATTATTTSTPTAAAPPSPSPSPIPVTTTKDHTFLRHPPLFHPLPAHLLPAPFRTHTPPPHTPLPHLLTTGHFRSAAISAAATLSDPHVPLTPPQIYALWYTRLAALTLLGCTPTAATEVKALSDLGSAFYRDPATGASLLPWELRVLAVRLQAVGYNDWRRSVALYYELGREARAAALAAGAAGEPAKAAVWRARLQELGVRVGSALVEMGDVAGAVRHLAGLRGGGGGAALALLWVRVGNVQAARECLGSEDEDGVLAALLEMAEGRWGGAVAAWRALEGAAGVAEEMRVCNLAVCLLYTGRLEEAREVLEALVQSGVVFPGLTFNLATVYELCSDNAKALKTALAERVAGMGGEMVGASFKM